MKIETAIKKVVEFLQNHPASSKEEIGTSTKVKGLELTNVIKRLRKDGTLVEDGLGAELKLSFKAAEAESTAPEEVVITEPEAENKKEPAKIGSRDNKKFSFNGNTLGKGPLVREVVKQYVVDHPRVSVRQLTEIFPTELLKPVRFGIVQEIEKARELSGARDRYFFKEEHQIKLGDKKIVVVCSQFTAANIVPFLATAKKLGFKIK